MFDFITVINEAAVSWHGWFFSVEESDYEEEEGKGSGKGEESTYIARRRGRGD